MIWSFLRSLLGSLMPRNREDESGNAWQCYSIDKNYLHHVEFSSEIKKLSEPEKKRAWNDDGVRQSVVFEIMYKTDSRSRATRNECKRRTSKATQTNIIYILCGKKMKIPQHNFCAFAHRRLLIMIESVDHFANLFCCSFFAYFFSKSNAATVYVFG